MSTLAGDGVFVIREAATKNLAALASLFGRKRTHYPYLAESHLINLRLVAHPFFTFPNSSHHCPTLLSL
jgi:hypothetical protein